MYGRSEIIFPLLHATSVVVLSSSIFVYPCDPGATILSKGDLPSWLKGLEVFIRLEEGLDAQRIENPECDKEQEDVLRCRYLLDPLHGASPKTFNILKTY